jgi:F-type H+-transporting ATPase subunit b
MSGFRSSGRTLRYWGVLMALALILAWPALVMASGGGEEGADAGAAGHGGVSEFQKWDFVWRTLNFIPLVVILFVVLKKPVAAFFSGRRSEIAHALDEFEKKKAEAEARFRELEGKLSRLDAEREKILADFVVQGEEEKARIITHAHELAERVKKQAEATIAQEVKTAKAQLIREIAETSARMAEDLIKSRIDASDQSRLIQEYLTKVVPN